MFEWITWKKLLNSIVVCGKCSKSGWYLIPLRVREMPQPAKKKLCLAYWEGLPANKSFFQTEKCCRLEVKTSWFNFQFFYFFFYFDMAIRIKPKPIEVEKVVAQLLVVNEFQSCLSFLCHVTRKVHNGQMSSPGFILENDGKNMVTWKLFFQVY